MKQILLFLRKYWPIILIVVLALFLRLFKISSYMTFLGDEGRDALVWLRMIKNGKFTLIGPMTSIGNMYLGPLFYYLMLPFYFVLGTTGPSIGTALFAGATTFMLWYFGKTWFSNRVGLISALLYAISPVAIELSRSSWNPNVMPFFSILIIWGIWQFWQKDKFYWLAIEGILLSFAIQSHYLGILLIPVVGLFFLIKLSELLKKKDKRWKKLMVNFLLLASCFMLLTFAPLLWFDLRHNFINYQSFYKFFSERQTTVNFKLYKAIPVMWPLFKQLIGRLILAKNEKTAFWPALLIIVFFLKTVFQKKDKKNPAVVLVMVWIIFGLLGMGLYKQHIYDHYFGFLFPAVFLTTALGLDWWWKSTNKIIKLLSVILLLFIISINLIATPLKFLPNMQLQHTEAVCKKIIEVSDGEQFNLGLIAKQNYDAGYRYFLEKNGHKPIEIDPQRAGETITKQLFVVCEEKECNPTTHPQAEIANFGWTTIQEQWDFPWGTKLFKLIHNEQKK